MGVGVDEENTGWRFRHATREPHGFGGGCGFVEQRAVGNVEAGQVHDHLLIVQQRFEAALADFGLIGRVGGVPAGIFQNVAEDDFWRHRAVVTHADHRGEDVVPLGGFAQIGECRALGHGRAHIEFAL